MSINKYDIDEINTKFSFKNYIKALKYLKKYKWQIFWLFIIDAIVMGSNLFIIKQMQYILDNALGNSNYTILYESIAIMIGLVLIFIVSDFIEKKYILRVNQNIVIDIKNDLFTHIQKLPFEYFDTILSSHGASAEAYTKALLKAYMSFGGSPKYSYDSGMTYDIFREIATYDDDLSVKIISEASKGFVTVADKAVGDLVFAYGNKIFYNPSYNDTYYLLNAEGIVIMNDEGIGDLMTEQPITFNSILVNKPLLCAVLYKHDKGDIVPRVLEAEQYTIQDTIVRKGYENGVHCVMKLASNYEEKRLYGEDGSALCDSTGVHCSIIEHRDTCSVHRDYNERLQRISYRISKDSKYYSYDENDRLESIYDNQSAIFYEYLDSSVTGIIQNWENNTTTVRTERSYQLAPLPVIEDRVYGGLYRNLETLDTTYLLEVTRYTRDGAFYDEPNLWAIEQYGYDETGRLIGHQYFDRNQTCVESVFYDYATNTVQINYYDDDNLPQTIIKDIDEYRQ